MTNRRSIPTMALLLLLLLLMVMRGAEGYSGKVLLVSMDGFRWDYLQSVSGLGNFTRLQKTGSYVDYVNNTFITKTAPCHYTIVTGLHAENHGVVANAMYDPERNATFSFHSREEFWFEGGEPVWVTAEKQQKRTGVYFWQGGESKIRGYRPSIYKPFNSSVPFPQRVETAVNWFHLEALDFVALYFHEPDSAGHQYGPHSNKLKEKVREMDGILGLILDTLDKKNLTDIVNVIITSDHGMTDVSVSERLLDLWRYVDRSMVERVPDSGVVTAILPKAGREEDVVKAAKAIPHVQAYRKQDIPEHFHYKHHPRIMPVIIIADEGWLLSADYEALLTSGLKGNHGYSNKLPSMKPIFLARGPDFHKGVKSTSIRSVDIYPLLCRLLNIEAAANNGSLLHTAHFLLDGANLAARNRISCWVLFSILLMSLVFIL